MSQEKVDAFLEMMQAERGSSQNTIAAYRRDLTHFMEYLKGINLDSMKLEGGHLKAYLADLQAQGISAKTQSRHLSAIREFYRFSYSENWIHENPCDYIDMPNSLKACQNI